MPGYIAFVSVMDETQNAVSAAVLVTTVLKNVVLVGLCPWCCSFNWYLAGGYSH